MANRVVYDSDLVRPGTCATCGKRLDRCACEQRTRRAADQQRGPTANVPRDGVVRVMRDRKSRGGKVVTVIAGLPGPPAALTQLASELKRMCGTGGTVRGDVVEIQGDHRDRLVDELRDRGFTVKAAGG